VKPESLEIDWTTYLPWILTIIFGIIAWYFRQRSLKYTILKEKREAEKYEKEKIELLQNQEKPLQAYQKYKNYIYEEFRFINFKGLGVGGVKLELKSAYVKLRAQKHYLIKSIDNLEKYDEGEKVKSKTDKTKLNTINETIKNFTEILEDILLKKQPHESLEIREVVQSSLKRKKVDTSLRLLIVGNPGSGKTTLLKWLALQACEEQGILKKYTPIFFRLKNIGENSKWLNDSLKSLISTHLHQSGHDNVFIETKFRKGELLILLDGLDEIADEKLREQTIEWLERQNIEKNFLIISSRFSGINQSNLCFDENKTKAFAIQQFQRKDIAQFLTTWYLQVETAQEDTEKNREFASLNSEELLQTLSTEKHEGLNRIAVNPLLLTLIAIIHYRKGKLPRFRYKLYEECIQVLADTWLEQNRKAGMQTNYDECLHLLSLVASAMMNGNYRTIKQSKIQQILSDNGISLVKQKIFFEDVVQKAGILVASEGTYEFLHLTFQEYLTAYHYSNSANPEDIFHHLSGENSSFWYEPIRLLINLGNSIQLFQIINQNLSETVYWSNISLWEDCLFNEVTVSSTRSLLEEQLAKKAWEILTSTPNDPKFNSRINHLWTHVYLYRMSQGIKPNFVNQGQIPPHPFVRSVSTFFEKNPSPLPIPSNVEFHEWWMEYDNRIFLTYIKPKKITSICGILFAHLHPFLAVRISEDLRSFPNLWNIFELQNLIDLQPLIEHEIDIHLFRHFRNFENTDLTKIQSLRSFNYLEVIESIVNKTIVHVSPRWDSLKPEVEKWARQTFQTLQEMNARQITHNFPNSNQLEIEQFKELSFEDLINKNPFNNAPIGYNALLKEA